MEALGNKGKINLSIPYKLNLKTISFVSPKLLCCIYKRPNARNVPPRSCSVPCAVTPLCPASSAFSRSHPPLPMSCSCQHTCRPTPSISSAPLCLQLQCPSGRSQHSPRRHLWILQFQHDQQARVHWQRAIIRRLPDQLCQLCQPRPRPARVAAEARDSDRTPNRARPSRHHTRLVQRARPARCAVMQSAQHAPTVCRAPRPASTRPSTGARFVHNRKHLNSI